MGVIYGQRRIGKTSLIKKVIKSYDSLYFLARDTSLQEISTNLGRSIEIDGISESFDKKHLLIVEAKYRDKDISKEIYDHLVESTSIFKGYKTKSYYLISKKGFSDNIRHLQDDNLHLITLDQMMGEC